jgi:hypothetical protein
VAHLLDILLNVLVIAIAILAYNWLNTSASSPIAGKL